MSTILPVTPETIPSVIQQAHRCIGQGGVLAVGTESFYGLAARALDPESVSRVAGLKGRTSKKPILVLLDDAASLNTFINDVSPVAQRFVEKFWPGPLTLVLPARANLPPYLTSETGMIGVRCPALEFLQALLKQTGPLTGTSANRTEKPPACSAQEVLNQFGKEIDLILDTGPTPGGLPSTVLEIGTSIRLLRPGLVPRGEIEAVLAAQNLNLSV